MKVKKNMKQEGDMTIRLECFAIMVDDSESLCLVHEAIGSQMSNDDVTSTGGNATTAI